MQSVRYAENIPDTSKPLASWSYDLMNSIPQRECPICKQTFPLTPVYWHKNKARKSGLNAICKECSKSKAKLWREENPELSKQKSLDYAASHREEACIRAQQWRENNPERKRANDKRNYEENKDRRLAQGREWAETHPEEIKAIKQAYIDRDPERRKKQAREYRYRHPVRVKIQAKEQRIKHPATARRSQMKRRAMEKGAEGTYTDNDIRCIFEEQEGRCAFCGITLYFDIPADFHIDHLIPLNRGGSNWPDNIVLACPSCNSSRQDRLVEEWEKSRGW